MASETEQKKRKSGTITSPENSDVKEENLELEATLNDFVLDEVLVQDAQACKVVLLGSFKGRTGQAVLTLQKPPFSEDNITGVLSHCSLSLDVRNHIYHQFTGLPNSVHNPLKVDIVFPATEHHISKCRLQPAHMVRETPDMYRRVHKPLIESIPPNRIQWVYNILDKTAEVERMLMEDSDNKVGFMLHPDLKWNQKSLTDLYCIIIVRDRTLRSVRDLTLAHEPLLRNIQSKVPEFLHKKFGVAKSLLRMFVHYVPSYYHLHIHVTVCNFDGPGVHAGRAILLEDIIDNIVNDPDYYQTRDISMRLPSNHGLYTSFSEAGLLL